MSFTTDKEYTILSTNSNDEISLNGHKRRPINPFEREIISVRPTLYAFASTHEDHHRGTHQQGQEESPILSNIQSSSPSLTSFSPIKIEKSSTVSLYSKQHQLKKIDLKNSSIITSWKPLIDDEDKTEYPTIVFPSNQPKCFGLTIKQSQDLSPFYYDGLKVPVLMYRCFRYLDEFEAYKEVGIFRLSSIKSEINHLEKLFNQNGDVNLLTMNPRPSIHAITTLFKRWLRSNQKILIDEDCSQLNKLTFLKNNEIKLREFNSILDSLPFENFQILKCLFLYLDKILSYSMTNKSSIDSLAMLFSANISNDPTGRNVPILKDLLTNRALYFKSCKT